MNHFILPFSGVAGCGLFDHSVLALRAAAPGARAQRLQAVRLAGTVRHPPRTHHHDHAGRILRNLLLLIRLALSGLLSTYPYHFGHQSSKAVFATGPVRTGPMVPKLGLVPNLGPVPGPVPQNYPKFNTFSVY